MDNTFKANNFSQSNPSSGAGFASDENANTFVAPASPIVTKKKSHAGVFILIFLLLAALGGAAYEYVLISSRDAEISSLNNKIKSLNSEISALNEKLDKKSEEEKQPETPETPETPVTPENTNTTENVTENTTENITDNTTKNTTNTTE